MIVFGVFLGIGFFYVFEERNREKIGLNRSEYGFDNGLDNFFMRNIFV